MMWLKLFISMKLVYYSSAICDVCRSGKAACHSKNTYSICINDVPTRNIITCPVGYTCTGEKYICYLEVRGYTPICNPTDGIPITVASTTPTTTTTLTSTKTPIIITTPTTTTKTSTIATTPTITTTTEDTSSLTFCEKNPNGDYVNENDASCKTYRWCYLGREKIKPCQEINSKETYFNGTTCVTEKPGYCT